MPDSKISYFANEKGDFTITLHDQPVAICLTEEDALVLVNHVNHLNLRIDTLSEMYKRSQQELREELNDNGSKDINYDLLKPE